MRVKIEHRLGILNRPDPAPDRERDEHLLGGARNDLQRGRPALV